MTKTLEDIKKQRTFIKGSLLATKKTGKADVKSGKNEGKKLAAGGTKAKGKKGAKKKARSKPNAKATSNDNNKKEQSPSKGRTKIHLVSIFLIILHPVIPPILSHASVELVWIVLLPPFLGVLIGQSVCCYS